MDCRDLEHFLEPVGATVHTRSDGSILISSGDPNYVCAVEDGHFVLRRSERGAVTRPDIVSDNVGNIEKYLSYTLGFSVRRKLGLPIKRLSLPALVLGSNFGGFQVSGILASVRLEWSENGVPDAVFGLGRFAAAEFLLYARFSAAEIRRSFVEPSGLPLFSDSISRGDE